MKIKTVQRVCLILAWIAATGLTGCGKRVGVCPQCLHTERDGGAAVGGEICRRDPGRSNGVFADGEANGDRETG